MSLHAITCSTCGGAVVVRPGAGSPHCVYCGASALTSAEQGAETAVPEVALPFVIDADAALAVFRRFARSNPLSSGALRTVGVNLRPVLLPAWCWSGIVQTWYAALVNAPSRSRKMPRTGVESQHIEGAVVLASSALTPAEFVGVGTFELTDQVPFDPDGAAAPFEPIGLSRRAAHSLGRAVLLARHRSLLRHAIHAVEIRTSARVEQMVGQRLLLPVYIGAYRYKERLYRVVINGQSGKLHGKAPVSPVRVAVVVVGTLFFLFGFATLSALYKQWLRS